MTSHNQDFTINAGYYESIFAELSDFDTATSTITSAEWYLKGLHGVDLISKPDVIIGFDCTTHETVVIFELPAEDTAGLRKGDYYHICQAMIDGVKVCLFDGLCHVE